MLTAKPRHGNGTGCKHELEREPFRARHPAARDRAHGGAGHYCVDIGVVPHVEHAGGAGARGNAEKGDETDEWIEVTRRNQQPDQCGEHDKRHDSRLHQRDQVTKARVTF